MKCPSCNKFAGLDVNEPEIDSEDFDAKEGSYRAEVRLVRISSCCGDEMKEANFEFEGEMPEESLKKHQGDKHDLSANFTASVIEEGGGRYAKSYFGVTLDVTVSCACQKNGDAPIWTNEQSDKMPASSMDELA